MATNTARTDTYNICTIESIHILIQESPAIAKKSRDAVRFGLMFTDIHYKFKSSQAPKARLQSSRDTGDKKNRI